MLINFLPVLNREKTLFDLATAYSPADLSTALNSYVDTVGQIIGTLEDDQVTCIPPDPAADDPYAATEADRYRGWNLAHLVLHVTASAEEAAAFSSLLARGVAIGGRLRSEGDWRQVTTRAAVLTRLEESRRICRAYLATWPDQPDLVTVRILPENAKWPAPNAPVAFLFGLLHWHSHLAQFEQVAAQARAASGEAYRGADAGSHAPAPGPGRATRAAK
jgi:hypothetical protein